MANKTFDREYQDAVRAAAVADSQEPRAISARYDRRAHRIVVELNNGASFIFPPELAQGLAGASAKDLAQIEISPSGRGLHWPRLDADFSLSGLLAGRFGAPSWMAERRRQGRNEKSTVETIPAQTKEKSIKRRVRS